MKNINISGETFSFRNNLNWEKKCERCGKEMKGNAKAAAIDSLGSPW